MYAPPSDTKIDGRCRDVAISGSWTVFMSSKVYKPAMTIALKDVPSRSVYSSAIRKINKAIREIKWNKIQQILLAYKYKNVCLNTDRQIKSCHCLTNNSAFFKCRLWTKVARRPNARRLHYLQRKRYQLYDHLYCIYVTHRSCNFNF